MASNLLTMASNLPAMNSNLITQKLAKSKQLASTALSLTLLKFFIKSLGSGISWKTVTAVGYMNTCCIYIQLALHSCVRYPTFLATITCLTSSNRKLVGIFCV